MLQAVICFAYIGISSALNIELYDDFKIEFNPECSEYFAMQGNSDFAYLYRQNETVKLWVTRNHSYEIYTIRETDRVLFEWPAKTVNGLAMNLVLTNEQVNLPYHFQNNTLLCDVYGASTGSLIAMLPTSGVYKCVDKWIKGKLEYIVVFMLILLAGSLIGNEPLRTLFRSEVSRIVQRGRTILQRGQSYQPRRYEETGI